MSFVVIWIYHVKPEWQSEFEQAYGPHGEWAALFRKTAGYIRTELLRDTSMAHRYTTIDYWVSEKDYVAFHDQFSVEYQALDAQFEGWAIRETLIGMFTIVPE